MNVFSKTALAAAATLLAAQAAAQVTFYERDGYQGRSFTTEQSVTNFKRSGFNDRASSVVVRGDRSVRWELCEDTRFGGRCMIVRPGEYPSLAAIGLNNSISSVRAVSRNARIDDERYAPLPAPAQVSQIVFYEHDGFQGRTFTADSPVVDLRASGFNNRASSAVVQGERWEACDDTRFGGRCVVLRPGQYVSLGSMGMSSISSVRAVRDSARVDDWRYAPLPAPPQVSQIVFYEHDGFKGRSFTANSPIVDFRANGFSDRASSAVVQGERWEVCDDTRFGGRCVVLRPGPYASLRAMSLNDSVSSVRAVRDGARIDDSRYAPMPMPAPPPAQLSQVVFYENEGFQGRTFSADSPVQDFRVSGFNDRASSVVVRGERWEVCDDISYGGRCVVLRPGQYASLGSMGLNDRVSSVRSLRDSARIDDDRYSPIPAHDHDYGRRDNERLYQANITSVRAVVGTPAQRCWVEREQVAAPQQQGRGDPNLGGAVIGAVLGGILGHQVGGGSGKDVATAIGVIGGAAVGANVGRNSGGQQATTQDVQRCTNAPAQAKPDYWDVTYNFRGQDYRVQMTTAPGATITVNDKGEPRV